jgi:phosphoenolpyruvate carboxylase
VKEVNATLRANNISKLNFTEVLGTLKYIENLYEERQFTSFKEASEAYRGAMRDLSTQLVELANSAATTHNTELQEIKQSRKQIADKFVEVLEKLKECNALLKSKRT